MRWTPATGVVVAGIEARLCEGDSTKKQRQESGTNSCTRRLCHVKHLPHLKVVHERPVVEAAHIKAICDGPQHCLEV